MRLRLGLTRRLLAVVVAALAWTAGAIAVLAQPAAAMTVLPSTLPDHGQLDYLGLDGDAAVAVGEADGAIVSVPLDGGAAQQLGTVPSVPDPGCTSGDPEDTVTGSWFATGEAHLVSAGFWGCKLGDGSMGQMSVGGPFSGPFVNTNNLSCFDYDVAWAVSSDYAACAELVDGTVYVSPLVPSARARTLTHLGRLDSLKLAGPFLATAASSVNGRLPATIAVTDLRNGRKVLSVRVRTLYDYAIGDDGTLIVAAGRRHAQPCSTFQHLAWYSLRAPRAHRLRYTACTRKLLLRGGTLVYQAPGHGGLIAIKRATLGRSHAVTLTRFSARGALLDADAAHVLATDVDCSGTTFAFVAPGGTSPAQRCR